MKNGKKKFLLKTTFFVLPVCIGFEVLFRLGFAPVVTNSTFLDHKLLWLQQHPVKEVRLMAVGSSITLYSLDSRVITGSIHLPYYNFGSWNLQIGDTRRLLDFLVPRYHPDYVIMCATVGDFTNVDNPTYSNYTQAGSFVRDRFPELFYLTQFHSLHQLALRKYTDLDLRIDQWGGGKLIAEPEEEKIADANRRKISWDSYLVFRSPGVDGQLRALDSLCATLQARKIKLIFIQAPLKASFLGTDSNFRLANRQFADCGNVVRKHDGVYFNYYDTTLFRDSLFTDAMHLNPAGAKLLTEKLVLDLRDIVKYE